MPVLNVYVSGSGDDGHITATSTNYPLVPTQVDTTNGSVIVSKYNVGGTQYGNMAMIRFNTSSLPSNAIVTSANLVIYVQSRSFSNYRNLLGAWASSSAWPIDVTDWTDPVGTTAFTESIANVTYNAYAIPLTNAAANISKTGYTALKIGVSGTEQANGMSDQVFFASYDYGNQAYLAINYKLPIAIDSQLTAQSTVTAYLSGPVPVNAVCAVNADLVLTASISVLLNADPTATCDLITTLQYVQYLQATTSGIGTLLPDLTYFDQLIAGHTGTSFVTASMDQAIQPASSTISVCALIANLNQEIPLTWTDFGTSTITTDVMPVVKLMITLPVDSLIDIARLDLTVNLSMFTTATAAQISADPLVVGDYAVQIIGSGLVLALINRLVSLDVVAASDAIVAGDACNCVNVDVLGALTTNATVAGDLLINTLLATLLTGAATMPISSLWETQLLASSLRSTALIDFQVFAMQQSIALQSTMSSTGDLVGHSMHTVNVNGMLLMGVAVFLGTSDSTLLLQISLIGESAVRCGTRGITRKEMLMDVMNPRMRIHG